MEVAHNSKFDFIDYIAISASILGVIAMILLILKIVGLF